jgi:galactokinase
MMGGGFGGCTINLSAVEPSSEWKNTLIAGYTARFGHPCEFMYVSLAAGATSELLA